MSGLTASVAAAMVKALEVRRIKRAELARMLDVTPPYVTKLLSGDENMTLAQVVRVLDALRFRLDVRIVRVRRKRAGTREPGRATKGTP